jgi:hypothetical protein
MKNRSSLIIVLVILALGGRAQQTGLLVNGEHPDNTCAKIVVADGRLDTIAAAKVKIYHAEISDDCLEVSVIYGGCNANVELVTDNQPVESQSLKLYVSLNYISDDHCKALVTTKLKFDLSPFKNIRTGQSVFVTLMGTNYSLRYDNFNK